MIIRIGEVVERFPEDFLNFESDTIEKQSIINVSSKSYASV